MCLVGGSEEALHQEISQYRIISGNHNTIFSSIIMKLKSVQLSSQAFPYNFLL